MGCGPPSKGSLEKLLSMSLYYDSGFSAAPRTQQLNGCAVRGPNRKLGRGPEGDFCLERESRLSPHACLKTKKGACACARLCEAVPFKTVKRHMHSHTNTQTLAYRLFCSSICVPLAVQFEGVGHCYAALNRAQDFCFQAGVTTLPHKLSTGAQPLLHTQLHIHTPLQLAVKLGPFTTSEASEDTKRFTQGRLSMHVGCCVYRITDFLCYYRTVSPRL